MLISAQPLPAIAEIVMPRATLAHPQVPRNVVWGTRCYNSAILAAG